MCKTYQKLPSDPFWQEMDPYEKLWLFYAWATENELDLESLRDQAILIGSFTNPDMAKKMVKAANPDYQSTDDDYERSMQEVIKSRNKELKGISRRRKRKQLAPE